MHVSVSVGIVPPVAAASVICPADSRREAVGAGVRTGADRVRRLGDVADEDVVRVLSQRVRHVLERAFLGLAEPDSGLAGGGVVAELGDVAPAGLPHVRLAGLEAAELQRPGLGAVYECIDVSLSSIVVASSNLPLGICFVDAKAGADTQGAPLRRAALHDVLTPWLLSPRTRHAASEPFVPSCLTVRHGSSLGRLLHSAERESPRPLRAVARGVFLLVPLWQGDVTGIVAV